MLALWSTLKKTVVGAANVAAVSHYPTTETRSVSQSSGKKHSTTPEPFNLFNN